MKKIQITEARATMTDMREENESLRERVRYLETVLAGDEVKTPVEWGLTRSEEKAFLALTAREHVTRDHIMAAVYRGFGDQEPEPRMADVFIYRIRKKVTRFGIIIHNHSGRGWMLDTRTREKFAPLRRRAA